MIVAQAAGDGSASRKVLLDERPHHVALKPILVINHVVGDADGLSDATGVVHIVQRAATPLHRLGHALMARETALVPKLHRQADDLMSLGPQYGRHSGRINPTRHSNGDG